MDFYFFMLYHVLNVMQNENLKSGSGICYQKINYFVTDEVCNIDSKEYTEIQWTLINKNKQEYYLLNCKEPNEESWILSKQISISQIHCDTESGVAILKYIKRNSSSNPPPKLFFNNLEYHFHESTEAKAKDDVGKYVTKITWDYFDNAKTKNLAVEIWKEPDADYPEAYEGTIINFENVRILSYEELKELRSIINSGSITAAVVISFFVFAIISCFGVPIEFSFPIVGLLILTVVNLCKTNNTFFTILNWSLIFFISFGCGLYFNLNFYIIAILSCIFSFILSLLPGYNDIYDINSFDRAYNSFLNILPPIFLYSFTNYFVYAPTPRNLSQFFSALILPFIFGLLYFCFQYSTGFMYEKTESTDKK